MLNYLFDLDRLREYSLCKCSKEKALIIKIITVLYIILFKL